MNKMANRERQRLFLFHSTTHYLGSVHTSQEIFEKAALSPTPTIIRHKNRASRKRSSKRRNLKTPAEHEKKFGKVFENDDFTIFMYGISQTEFSSNTNAK